MRPSKPRTPREQRRAWRPLLLCPPSRRAGCISRPRSVWLARNPPSATTFPDGSTRQGLAACPGRDLIRTRLEPHKPVKNLSGASLITDLEPQDAPNTRFQTGLLMVTPEPKQMAWVTVGIFTLAYFFCPRTRLDKIWIIYWMTRDSSQPTFSTKQSVAPRMNRSARLGHGWLPWTWARNLHGEAGSYPQPAVLSSGDLEPRPREEKRLSQLHTRMAWIGRQSQISHSQYSAPFHFLTACQPQRWWALVDEGWQR